VANARELAEQIAADKEAVAELAAMVAAGKDKAENIATALGTLGFEGRAAKMQQVAQVFEEAERIRVFCEGGLEKARWQVMSAVHGTMGPGAPGSGAIVPLVRAEGPDGALAGGLDAVPPHVRHGASPSGDELTGVDPSLSPFQKEHEGAGDDRAKNRAQRFSRKLVRNIEDISGSSKETAKTTYQDLSKGYEPPKDPQSYETVGVAEPPAAVIGPQPAPKAAVEDTVASMVVMAVVAVEGLSRFARSRGNKGNGKLSAV
jgi:hypothetical protein